ncbi:OOP family OmpA-OmpF porin [Albidovulum inexpectatum]|uniref:OOP family OmpA-OmpF porin n=1 Tax=Albidovulum inexpectatum TaxID=196587 RepID=A0A2S5JHP6_9RHOB|nr:OmpA family protein [Albidovulum inexpectatum]PPB81066.1 OOP family OmpA-OmpF porin [Albidovulum inexpectatum]
MPSAATSTGTMRRTLLTGIALAVGLIFSIGTSVWSVGVLETRSVAAVENALERNGLTWVHVDADGLQVQLSGTAPNEAARFRALSVAAGVIDSDRVVDLIDVQDRSGVVAPEFSLEILRNSDGISLIGLVPESFDQERLVSELSAAAKEDVVDLVETADYPPPEGWEKAVAFGAEALKKLPRSKISITAQEMTVTAISDSAAEKARIEAELARRKPAGLRLVMDISAPRPVIAPFTLRFVMDDKGARFDACAADSESARDRILAAASQAGAEGKLTCTIGLGVPTPEWADAVSMAIRALARLGSGSVTFSDTDVALIAGETVSQDDFDRVVGELESNLPEVFSLEATLTPRAEEQASTEGPREFVAVLDEDGRIELRGRVADDLAREAVESFARAEFGSDAVLMAARLDPEMPRGWTVRVLAALDALGEVDHGTARILPDRIEIAGVSGSQNASDEAARILTQRLGEGQKLTLDIRYDESLDPLKALPTPEECVARINAIMAESKITFEPGSAQITPEAGRTLDRIAEQLRSCADVRMEVGGHTDSQGREEMNQQLSQRRAEAVIAALLDRRVLTSNLTAVGYGEAQPIAPNDTEEGREANRRIEFRLLDTDIASDETGDKAAGEPRVAVKTPGPDTVRPKPRPNR